MASTPLPTDPLANEATAEPLLSFSGPLGELLRQCRHSFYFVAFLTVVLEVLSFAPIVYMLNLYDRVLTSRSGTTLLSLLLLIAGVHVLTLGLEWVRTRLMIRISLRIDWELADRAFDASFRRTVGRKKINVNEVMSDLLVLRQFLTGAPILALMSAPFALVFAVLAAVFHIYLAVFAVAAMIIMFVAAYVTGTLSTPVLKAANTASTEARRVANESLRGSETAFALGMQGNIRRRWHEKHLGFLELQVNASEASGALGGITNFLAKLLPSLQIALSIYLAISGLITGGMVIAANMLLNKTIAPMRMILNRFKDIAAARESYERLSQLLREDERNSRRMKLPPPAGQLRVENLTVEPPNTKKAVLYDINFSLDSGQVLAVVGASAAGKTSLIKSLIGMWQAKEGSVRLDGADVSEWLRDDLGRYVGYVPQDIDFFDGTVAENIARLGDVEAADVVEATRRVGVHQMILGFADGYETRLGENGHFLTGGQRQRLALARALYGGPKYVVMDEPNASLDEVGQEALMNAVREMRRSRATVIFTTHRMQLLDVADKVLVLADGRMKWMGSVTDFRAQIAGEVAIKTVTADTSTSSSAKKLDNQAAKPLNAPPKKQARPMQNPRLKVAETSGDGSKV